MLLLLNLAIEKTCSSPQALSIDEPQREKIGLWGYDQVRHKPVCEVTEDALKLDILDLRRREIVLSV